MSSHLDENVPPPQPSPPHERRFGRLLALFIGLFLLAVVASSTGDQRHEGWLGRIMRRQREEREGLPEAEILNALDGKTVVPSNSTGEPIDPFVIDSKRVEILDIQQHGYGDATVSFGIETDRGGFLVEGLVQRRVFDGTYYVFVVNSVARRSP